MGQNKNILYSWTGDKEEDKVLLEPVNYIYCVPGTDIRPKLGEAFNHWLKIPQDKFNAIQEIIQILHTSTLLIDDIQDDSTLRSLNPAAHHIYSVAATINSAIYANHIALERILALNHPEAVKVYLEEELNVYRGQGLEIYWRDNCICPPESMYKRMAIRKTGVFFNTAVRFMQLFSNCKQDFTHLIETISVYYQIRNDYFDLYREEYTEDSHFAEDVSLGIFNFLIIHAVQSHPEDREIIYILRRQTKDIEVRRYCINLLKKFGSFAYTKTVLEEMDKKIRDEIQRLGGNAALVKILDSLLDWKH
ncbi:geranylgeranyl pyrophosphate synthase-like isoform X1 [Colletes gigas]|uniref:geranylgeranyl pyrophosphate synthase-like isoform X1 n=1 Tax=Colletes gigas TaxID=935657 RepID=UPI001C9A495F|nr:geranylgeranyl pyrophosphate synthase-like isoform X1 [Colletes gigas]